MRLERPDLRLVRPDFKPERPDLRPARPDLMPGGLMGGGGQTDNEQTTNERKSTCVLQDFIPFGAAAQKDRRERIQKIKYNIVAKKRAEANKGVFTIYFSRPLPTDRRLDGQSI